MSRLFLILVVSLIVIRPDLKVIATVNPSQEFASETYCQIHGCGDKEPMDYLDT